MLLQFILKLLFIILDYAEPLKENYDRVSEWVQKIIPEEKNLHLKDQEEDYLKSSRSQTGDCCSDFSSKMF